MKIGDFFVRLGVKADTFTVRDFAKAIGDIPFATAGAITSLTGLSVGFLELTKHTLDISNNLGVFRAETGLSVEELQKWQAVAKQTVGTTDFVQSSIMGLSNAMAQLRLGNPQALLAFGRLGVRPTSSNPFDVLRQIGNSPLMKKDPNVARQLMSSLGVDPQMMRLLGLSPSTFNRMASGGVVVNEQQLRAMQDFQEAIGRFTLTIEKAFVPALEKVEPFLADIAGVLGDFIKVLGTSAEGYGGLAKLYTGIKKEGGLGTFIDHLGDSMMSPQQMRDPHVINTYYNATQNIHSTADPHEVARIAKEHLDRDNSNATKHFNNGGY